MSRNVKNENHRNFYYKTSKGAAGPGSRGVGGLIAGDVFKNHFHAVALLMCLSTSALLLLFLPPGQW